MRMKRRGRVGRGRAWAACLAVGAAACGGAAPRPAGAGAAGAAAADAAAVDTADLARALEAAGLAPSGAPLEGFLVEREARSHALDVPAGRCLTLAARAAAGLRDIDTGLYTPAGEVLAEDLEPDPHPTIQVCGGPRGRRVHLVVRAYAGNGSYRVLVHESDEARLAAGRAVVGGKPGVAATPEAGEAEAGLGAVFETTLRDRGYERVDEVRVTLPPDGAPLRRPLAVEAGFCYAAALFPLGGAKGLALRAETGWGEPRVAADPEDGFQALQVCPGETSEWALVLEGPAAGEALLRVYRTRSASSGGASGLWLGSPRFAALDGEAWRAALAAALDAEGLSPRLEAVARGRLSPGSARSAEVRLPGGRCAVLAAVPEAGLGEVHLRVLADDGEVLGESLPWAAGRPGGLVVACPARATRAAVHLVGRRGAGTFALVRADGGRGADAGMAGKALLARLEARRTGGVRVEATAALDVAEAAPRQIPLDLPAGWCAEVALLARDGAYRARLVGAGDATRAVDAGPNVRLVGCRGPADPALALEISAAAGPARGVGLVAVKPAP